MLASACFWTAPAQHQLSARAGTMKHLVPQVNHQNGRDTHLRQIRIFGPRETPNLCTDTLEELSPEFSMYSCVR